MSKAVGGIAVPLGIALVAGLLTMFFSPSVRIEKSVAAGLLIALVQSFVSTGALHWAWKKPYFYWIWGAGFFFRLIVFAVTAFVMYRTPDFSLVATMVTLVSSTTIFLVFESWYLLDKK